MPGSARSQFVAFHQDGIADVALDEAVMQVAIDLVTGVKRSEAAGFLPDVLGKDPLDYIFD